MKIRETTLEGCLIIDPNVFADDRGWFFESFNSEHFGQHGLDISVKQVNVSYSTGGTLRGLHYQWPRPQGKLVSVIEGEVWDVAVDVRRGSPQFGRWTAAILNSDNKKHIWIPEGFAHGFVTLSEKAVFTYMCTDIYNPEFDANISWDDPDIAIDWPIKDVLISPKDEKAPRLKDIADDRLPIYPGAL